MRILIQAGHAGRTSGSTGAPGEQKWTMEIVPKIAQKLREHGAEVREINADPTDDQIAGDWDLFLAVHYDADVYDDRGGFIDIPDADIDQAHEESARIAEEMKRTYFPVTGIPNHPERSNANTKRYYMWKRLSAKTPCVIIEAGVGWRTEQDHKTLWFEQDKVVKGITEGILNALKPTPPENPCAEKDSYIEQLERDNKIISDLNVELRKQIDEHECPITPQPEPIKGFEVKTVEKFGENGELLSSEKTVTAIK